MTRRTASSSRPQGGRSARIALACLLLAAGTVAAQEPPAQTPQAPPPQAPPAPAAPSESGVARQGEPLRLTIEQALEIALSTDLGLQQQAVSVDVARFDYAGSWGSFDPVLTATAGVVDSEFEANSSLSGASVLTENSQYLNSELLFPLTTGGTITFGFDTQNTKTNNSFQLVNPSTTDNLSLGWRQPLLRGAWREYATSRQREANLTYLVLVELYRQRRQELLLTVHDAYWDLVATQELLTVADATLALGREQLEQNRRRLEVGVGTEVEVLQAEANVAQRIEQRLLAEVNVRSAADVLKAILFPGVDPGTWNRELQPVTPLPQPTATPVPPWESALVVALDQRSELRQQRMAIDQGELRLERARSERKIGLDFNLTSTARGFDGDSADAFQSAAEWEFPSNRAELILNVPFGNRTAKNAERSARAQVQSARIVFDQIESRIASEVRDAVRQILYQAEAVKAAVTSLGLAQRQLSAEEARYKEGLSTTFQVLEFQQQLSTALSSEKRARVNYAKALAALRKAEGVLGEVQP
jgi:outer membrane protein